MNEHQRAALVRQIMFDFSTQTGLDPVSGQPCRYLWTDAFAVCNLLLLYHQSNEDRFKSMALALVDQVHSTLGRHRHDDPRNGWISGLNEEEGRLHPTAGGLRIGKKVNERGPTELFNEELEWNRDGQYYHYLTKWMHALCCVATTTGESTYINWAIELAKKVHACFVTLSPDNGQFFIFWKMSIDLSRPQVCAMGHHDPLDGLIVYRQLQLVRPLEGAEPSHLDLSDEINELSAMCQGKNWTTDDPLGIGGLLSNALQLSRLMVKKKFKGDDDLLLALLDDAVKGLENLDNITGIQLDAHQRLAFREFGLSIGLQALPHIQRLVEKKNSAFKDVAALRQRIRNLERYRAKGGEIERFWLEDANRQADTWRDHADINMVMQATSLAPEGFLLLPE